MESSNQFYDLREMLELLETKGELARVPGEVDWNLELGTLTREVYRRNGPALLFENITDYNTDASRCSKLTTGLLASFRRIALILGFEDEVPNRDLIRYVIEKNTQLIEPVLIEDGPVHDNVLLEDDIDLYDFPVPKWHHLDGGRYIGTMGCAVTRDPDSRQMNIGIYRGMLVDKNKVAALLLPTQNIGHHMAKYQARNEPMPVAWVYGWDPIMEFIAGSPIPAGTCEYDVMGGYRGAPAPLVRCKTVDLWVPASAEIVLEGFVSLDPSTFEMEGPFGEFSGYVSDVPTKRHVFQATALTHRNDPVFRGTLEGSLPNASGENSHMSAIQRAGIAWNVLRAAGIGGIRDIHVHPVNNGTTIIVQIEKSYEGQPKQIASALWGTGASQFRYKIVVVVDEDIDPSDYEAVDWAINYRVNPGSNDIVIFPGALGSPIDPSTPLEDRQVSELGSGLWNRMLIDATITWKFPRRPEWNGERYPPTVRNRPEDVELVKKRWNEYGFTNWNIPYA